MKGICEHKKKKDNVKNVKGDSLCEHGIKNIFVKIEVVHFVNRKHKIFVKIVTVIHYVNTEN
jgi:GTP cyclohydrolase I